MSDKFYSMVDARRQLLLIVCHHDEGLVLSLHECIDNILDEHAVVVVETMERLIEDRSTRSQLLLLQR